MMRWQHRNDGFCCKSVVANLTATSVATFLVVSSKLQIAMFVTIGSKPCNGNAFPAANVSRWNAFPTN